MTGYARPHYCESLPGTQPGDPQNRGYSTPTVGVCALALRPCVIKGRSGAGVRGVCTPPAFGPGKTVRFCWDRRYFTGFTRLWRRASRTRCGVPDSTTGSNLRDYVYVAVTHRLNTSMCVHVHVMSILIVGRYDHCPHCESCCFKEREWHTAVTKRCVCHDCRQDYLRSTEIDTMGPIAYDQLESEQ